MTTGSDAYHQGYSHGMTPGKAFDPFSGWSSVDKEQYRKGFDDARKKRGLR